MPQQRESPDDNLIYQGRSVTIRSISNRHGRFELKHQINSLTGKLAGRRDAAFQIVDTSLQVGRSGGRLLVVPESREGLQALKLTSAGASAPHIFLFVVREGSTLWGVHIAREPRSRLNLASVAAADAEARRWRDEGGPS